MKRFTIGTDVEFFLRRHGKFISAIPYVGDHENGTKYNPIKFPNGATLQRDNVLVEFATRPASGKKDFIESIRDAMVNMFSLLPSDVQVVAVSSVFMPKKELCHPEAMEFGCDPDFNAWKNGEVNHKPFGGNSTLRTAGAHIHVGHRTLLPIKKKLAFIRAMDNVHGIASVLLDSSPASVRRKQLYGKAGAHRPTPYGVEYRVLSNFWVRSPIFAELMYDFTDLCFNYSTIVQTEDTINSNQVRKAKLFWANMREIPSELRKTFAKCVSYKPKSIKKEWRVE